MPKLPDAKDVFKNLPATQLAYLTIEDVQAVLTTLQQMITDADFPRGPSQTPDALATWYGGLNSR